MTRIDYPLELIDPKTFEQIGVALARAVLGNGVEVFGDGPDGGREATFEGHVDWSKTPDCGNDSWDGYVVIQAKHRSSTDTDPQRNLTWLKRQVRDELESWTKADSNKRRVPQYLIFVTNARLSPAAAEGGIDSIHRYIAENSKALQGRGFKGWKVWHRDQIVSLLINYGEVRRAFPSFLTPAAEALLHRLESLDRTALQPTRDLLVNHAVQGLRHEQWVHFGEAGADSKKSICQVIVDLPIQRPDRTRGLALRSLVGWSEQVLRRSLTVARDRRHVVVTGAPGNGKSTISRYLVQLYRQAFLASDSIPQSLVRLLDCNARSAARLGLEPPRQQRWPVRIDLAEWASSDMFGKSFMQWLAIKFGELADQNVTASDLRRWLREWPWLVVFDGLDEVTNLAARQAILTHLADFIDEADDVDADLFLVVTTRPGGYAEELPAEHFTHFELDYFTAEEAIEYGQLITRARLADDRDRCSSVLERFSEASKDPSTLRLLKTPLQVLIITVILEDHRSLPVDRYGLFWTYFNTLFARERGKSNELATFLTAHRQEVTHLHEVVGQRLQIQSEDAANSRAQLGLDELQRIADERFQYIGYTNDEERRLLVRQMVDAAMQRLILLVPGDPDARGKETVTFELRSLQELMAARSLSNGKPSLVRQRLELLAPSPHWRNTWVFMAGRLFASHDEAQWSLVTELLSTLDHKDDWPGWLTPIAPGLAAELLDDGLASRKPKWQNKLLDIALSGLDAPLPIDLAVVARGLSVSWLGDTQQRIVQGRIMNALQGSEVANYAASRVLAESAPLRRAIGNAKVFKPLEVKTSAKGKNRRKLSDLVQADLAQLLGDVLPPDVQRALEELATIQTVEQNDGVLVGSRPKNLPTWSGLMAALSHPEHAVAFKMAFDAVPQDHWPLVHLAAREIYPDLARRPIGHRLAEIRPVED